MESRPTPRNIGASPPGDLPPDAYGVLAPPPCLPPKTGVTPDPVFVEPPALELADPLPVDPDLSLLAYSSYHSPCSCYPEELVGPILILFPGLLVEMRLANERTELK